MTNKNIIIVYFIWININRDFYDVIGGQLDDINYCNQLAAVSVPFFTLHQTELTNFASPMMAVASNLLNFLANRFFNSWTNLGCMVLTGNPSPITFKTDPVTMIVIANSITGFLTTVAPVPITTILPVPTTTTVNPYSIPTSSIVPTPSNSSGLTSVILPTNVSTTSGGTMSPTSTSTTQVQVGTSTTTVMSTLAPSTTTAPFPSTVSTTGLSSTAMLTTTIPNSSINLCGSSASNVNCTEFCPKGLNSECTTPGFTCFNLNMNDLALCNYNNFCGSNGVFDCMMPCPLGLDSQCTTVGSTCFKITTNFCNQMPSTTSVMPTTTMIPDIGTTQSNTTSAKLTSSGSRNEFYVHFFHLLVIISTFLV